MTSTLYLAWIQLLPIQNFMVQDLVGSLVAVVAFAAVLYTPGYLVAHATDLFGFKRQPFPERSIVAVALSFCTVPIGSYLVARAVGVTGVGWLLVGMALATVLLLQRNADLRTWSPKDRRAAALVLLGWTAFALLLLIDAQVGRKLYYSVVMADQSYRIAFTDAIVRTGIPPQNPLYFTGSAAPMHYYYFWYLLCAVVVKFAHVTARQAFIASSVWAGFGVLATVHLCASHFFHWNRRQRWTAYGLLLISGADLLPALGQAILQPTLNGDTEWWSVDPIDSWPDSLLWVPHHVASVLCCLIAFLFVWRTLERSNPHTQRWPIVFAALAFASAFGLSVYVAFGFALLMLAWLVWLRVTHQPQFSASLRRILSAVALSAFVLLPFVLELTSALHHSTLGKGDTAAKSPHMFTLSVRRMIDSELITGLPLFTGLRQAHPILLDQGMRLLLLLPGLAMELGLYGAVLVLVVRAQRRRTLAQNDPAVRTSVFLAVAGLVMTMFLSSSVITNNDFGYRAVMLPQFFLVLLATEVLGSWQLSSRKTLVVLTPGKRWLLGTLLIMGLAGTVYWAVLLRAWLPIEAAHSRTGYTPSPEEAFQTREAFATLDHVAPPGAVVAFRPIDPVVDRQQAVMVPTEFYQRMLVMNTGRQLLNAERECATQFGGDPSSCSAIQATTSRLYDMPAPDAAAARAYCQRFGVTYLVLSDRDPDWAASSGWPVTLPTVAVEPRLRILACS